MGGGGWLINTAWMNFRHTHIWRTLVQKQYYKMKVLKLEIGIKLATSYKYARWLIVISYQPPFLPNTGSEWGHKVEGVIHTQTHSHINKHIHSHTALSLVFLWSPVCILVGWPAVAVSVHTRWQCWLCQRHGNVAHLREMACPPSASRWEKQRCVTVRPFDLLTTLIKLDQLGNKNKQDIPQYEDFPFIYQCCIRKLSEYFFLVISQWWKQ